MTDTYGQPSSGSSRRADPPSLSGSRSPVRLQSERLQQRLAQHLSGNRLGSTMYSTTLKEHVTPAQRTFVRQSVSALRTSGSDFISLLAGWPTPMAGNPGVPGVYNPAGNTDFSRQAEALLWKEVKGHGLNMAGWPTPNAVNGDRAAYKDFDKLMARKAAGRQTNLQEIVMVAGWPTPATRDWKDTGDLSKSEVRKDGKSRLDTVPRIADLTGPVRLTATGQVLTGSSAGMASGGQLNPALSRWLMGLPPEWCQAAIRASRNVAARKKRGK